MSRLLLARTARFTRLTAALCSRWVTIRTVTSRSLRRHRTCGKLSSGIPITFTATVTGAPNPTGTVSFSATTYNGLNAADDHARQQCSANANGQASVTTSALAAGGAFLGNHFITAIYSGDGTHASAFGTMMQKVHANASTTALSVLLLLRRIPGQPVTLTATVGVFLPLPELQREWSRFAMARM